MKINTTTLTHKERIWLEKLLGQPIQMVGFGEVEISDEVFSKFEIGQEKLNQEYPLDYLIGEVKFLDEVFLIDENVLIPREETEYFVDYIVTKLQPSAELLVDIGAGCGVIGLSLADAYNQVFCTDISDKAAKICKKNIQILSKKNAQVFVCDLLDDTSIKEKIEGAKEWHLIANLPYLPYSEKRDALENGVFYEPDIALYSGDDGLDVFRKLIGQLATMQLPSQVFFELDPSNVVKADKMVEDLGYQSRVFNDVYARPRFIIGQLPKA